MTTRKPKLNLLYVSATETPWLQLAVVTPDSAASTKHARHWQAGRNSTSPAQRAIPPASSRTIH
jgi:hypothetical protein